MSGPSKGTMQAWQATTEESVALHGETIPDALHADLPPDGRHVGVIVGIPADAPANRPVAADASVSVFWLFETISGTRAVTITALTFAEVTGLTVTEVPESVAQDALKLAKAHLGDAGTSR